jgi:DNA-binding IclR family transcriptional regulator
MNGMRERTYGDEAYYARRDHLRELLAAYERPVTCSDLSRAFRAESTEVRAKLMSLRTDGAVTYDAATKRWQAA